MKTATRPPWTIIPGLFWLIFFLVIPLFFVLVFSLLHKGAFGQIEYHLDWSNYQKVFEPLYLRVVLRSVFLATYTTFICLALSYPLAYLMARSEKKVKSLLLALVVTPFWTNFVIRIYSLKLVLGDQGILNRWLIEHGWITHPLALTDNAIGIAIGMIYNYLPFMILPLYVALDKIDFTLLDAAYDLGATRTQMVIRVLFPLSLPGVVTGSLFVFIPAFGEFAIPELLGGSKAMYVGNLITETFLKLRDWPFGSALSMILVSLAMIAFIFVFKARDEGASHV